MKIRTNLTFLLYAVSKDSQQKTKVLFGGFESKPSQNAALPPFTVDFLGICTQ